MQHTCLHGCMLFRSWNLSFSFRRSPSPHIGRIITITFTSGMIELSVGAGGRSIIVTTRDGGGVVASNGSIPLTSTDTWIDVVSTVLELGFTNHSQLRCRLYLVCLYAL